MMAKAIHIIRANGTVEVLDKMPDLAGMQKAVGGRIEHVRVLDRIEPRMEGEMFIYTSMFVNDEGRLNKLPVNLKPTAIYQRNGQEQVRRGADEKLFNLRDAFIVGDALHFPGWTCDEVDAAYCEVRK